MNGTAGNVRYTPHPYLWMQTRLPDSWSFHAESIGTAGETGFIAGSAGTTTDSASGAATMSAVAPANQLSKFIGTGTSTLNLEIRDDSLLENLSSTPTEGTFLRSMLVNITLTVTYHYEPIPSSHKIIHLKKGAADNGSGNDWDNASPDLQPAGAAAQPSDEIWVAEGTSHPVASGGDRNISFEMQGGVSWYGGFAGNETACDQRNSIAYSTILSGDMNGDDGGGTGVNARWYHMSENSYQIVRAGNLITPATIDGFTITRGSFSNTFSGSPNIHHSCVKGLLTPGKGNINSAPFFFDQDGADGIPGNADDDLRLNNRSLCIDSGDDSAFPADLDAPDIAGLPRFQDGPFSAGTASDMGAYEFVPGAGTNPDNLIPTSSCTHVTGTANEVTFTDTSIDSDGTITHWVWNFGDDNGSAISSPTNPTVSGLTTGSLSISSPAPNSTVAGAIAIEANGN